MEDVNPRVDYLDAEIPSFESVIEEISPKFDPPTYEIVVKVDETKALGLSFNKVEKMNFQVGKGHNSQKTKLRFSHSINSTQKDSIVTGLNPLPSHFENVFDFN